MSSRTNTQSQARRRAGKRLAEAIEILGVSLRDISKETGIDISTLENLRTFTPHLSTIERVSRYIERVARQHYSSQDAAGKEVPSTSS